MKEDEIYKFSTQYRLWSFTRAELASRRSSTNRTASERVQEAIRRKRSAQEGTEDAPIDCLTVDEEIALLQHYTSQMMRISDAFGFPTQVKATAVQFLKRFYISHSPMTYHPKSIFPCCLFLATKTENNYISLADFAAKFKDKGVKGMESEDIIAPEFIIAQGLRFTFDVRHPFRGLRGGLMEMIAIANGEAPVLANTNTKSADIQEEMLNLPLASKTESKKLTVRQLQDRCGTAVEAAKDILASAGLLTDVYFHYTPAQIWFAALLLADEPLTLFYLSTKFTASGEQADGHLDNSDIANTLRTCSSMLTREVTAQPRQELVRIDKKLYQCQNPDKLDLLSLNMAQKRNGVENGSDEKALKKRKLERELLEKDGDIFGVPLKADGK